MVSNLKGAFMDINKAKLHAWQGNFWALCVFWAFVFMLYLPTANAGRVGDFPGWVTFLNSVKFTDYINRTGSGIPSMYQFTQIVTYVFYKLFGANAWLWHLLFITMQAVNALLLFTFCKVLLQTASVRNAPITAYMGTLLFCASPYISEVVVWESAFHYLLGLMLMLLILRCVQQYMALQHKKYLWCAGITFLLSSYSLEVFYLTPCFTLLLVLFYRSAIGTDKKIVYNALLYCVLLQAIFFAAHFIALHTLYHESIAHVTSASVQANTENLSKAPKYIFHLLLLGRFWPQELRSKIYRFTELTGALVSIYGAVFALLLLILFRYRQMSAAAKAAVLLFIYTLLSLALILPLWFPDSGLVIYDRYTYVLAAFFCILIASVINLIAGKKLFIAVMACYMLINLRFTHKANAYWQQSAQVVNNLLMGFPNDPSKKILLLNLPECLDGVQMVGTRDDGEFRMMYNAIMPQKLTNQVYDVEAFYMRSPDDGANVTVVNDSMATVTLNDWGRWWLYYGMGATSYENADFKVDMKDPGHSYNIILKHPADGYKLLYVTGGAWKTADWSKKNIAQY